MLKHLILAASLALAACSGIPVSVVESPAPLAQTTIDDKALLTAWKSFDASLDAINLVLDVKPSLIGTPGAVRVANAIDAVSLALTSAESAAAAGSTKDYTIALANARNALTEMRMALQAMKGN